jgi:hypothetical protein
LAIPVLGLSPAMLLGYWVSAYPAMAGRNGSVSGTSEYTAPPPSRGYLGLGPSSKSFLF